MRRRVKFCTLPPVWRAVKDAHNGGEPTNPLDVSIHASGRRLRHSDRWVVRLASGSSAGMAASRGLMRRASSPREATGLDLRSKFDVAGHTQCPTLDFTGPTGGPWLVSPPKWRFLAGGNDRMGHRQRLPGEPSPVCARLTLQADGQGSYYPVSGFHSACSCLLAPRAMSCRESRRGLSQASCRAVYVQKLVGKQGRLW